MAPKELFRVAAALAAGFLGGALSQGLEPAFAQPRNVPRVLTADRFVAADSAGNKRAEMGIDRDGRAVLHLYNERGVLLWSAPAGPGRIWPAGPER
jgi:hypothetical protein